jgi:hypothetical protein
MFTELGDALLQLRHTRRERWQVGKTAPPKKTQRDNNPNRCPDRAVRGEYDARAIAALHKQPSGGKLREDEENSQPMQRNTDLIKASRFAGQLGWVRSNVDEGVHCVHLTATDRGFQTRSRCRLFPEQILQCAFQRKFIRS